MTMEYRKYDKERDEAHVLRILSDFGWSEDGPEDMRLWLQSGSALVALH